MISYHKVLKVKTISDCDLKIITRDSEGKKHILRGIGFQPYAFIEKSKERLLHQFKNYISGTANEGFVDLMTGKSMYTVYFKHPGLVGKVRQFIGAETLKQADIHYELACMLKHNLGRYIAIDGKIIRNTVHVQQMRPMISREIETIRFEPFKEGYLDIEVVSEDGDFPDISEAKHKIISVVVSSPDEPAHIYFLGNCNFNTVKHSVYGMTSIVHQFNSEIDLIESVLEYMSEIFDVAVAWNSDFDHDYLVNRSKKLGLDLDWDIFQWFDLQKAVAAAQKFPTSYLALKKTFDDLYKFKRKSWKYLPEIFQSYYSKNEDGIDEINKDSIIYKYIQFRKTQSGADVEHLYNTKKFRTLLFYNACDVWDMIVLKEIGNFDGYLNMFDGLQSLNMNDLFFHNSKIEPNALRFCMVNKVASPSKLYIKGDSEEGAIVHEPKTGKILNNVIVLDFSRFYVSIILAKQVSPENVGNNPRKLFTKMPNGEDLPRPMFFLPALAHYLISERNYAENEKENAKDIYTKEHWRAQAWALKTTTSGLWGYISHSSKGDEEEGERKSKSCRYYAPHIADTILSESRSKNLALKEYIETNTDYEVVYGDTDSSFIGNEKDISYRDIDPYEVGKGINEYLQQLCDRDNYPHSILVKPEKIYDRVVLVSKKYYYGRIVWEDGKFLEKGKIEIKGMQAKRADHSQLAKDFQSALIDSHLDKGRMGIYKTIATFRKIIDENFSKIQRKNFDEDVYNFIESISIPLKINRPFDKYKSGAYKYYMDSAQKWNHFGNMKKLGFENNLRPGTKANIIQVKNCDIPHLEIDNKYLVYTQAQLVDWSKVEIDRLTMDEKTIQEKLNNILTSLGYRKDEIKSLGKGRVLQRPNL